MTAANPTMRPDERSTPPVMRMNAVARAMIALVDTWTRMSLSTVPLKKLGSTMMMMTISASRNTNIAFCVI